MKSTELPAPFYRGKVRELYEVDSERMILVASDRLSAFDVVFDEPLPGKGRILQKVSSMWFRALRSSGLEQKLDFEDHVLSDDVASFPEPFCNREQLRERAVLVRRTQRIDFECVVRGYLVGSGWKDYQATGGICGHRLPLNLRLADRLPAPLFTPATKAELGTHDENVPVAELERALGADLTGRLSAISLAIYEFAARRLEPQGILLADTKFEFGLVDNRIVLIDEVLTPDSSRYWDAAAYAPGKNQPSFDKQIVRDYLETLDWDKSPPAPRLPAEIVERALSRYREVEERVARALGFS